MRAGISCCFLMCGLISTFVGCGDAVDPNRPKTFPAGGQVTHKGQPVEGAIVMFVGANTGARGSIGKTDAAGNFSLTTFDAGDGALPGPYRITISKTIVEEVPERPAATPGAEPINSVSKEMLPTKYKDPSTSGLLAEITDGGENQFVFDLTD